MNLSNWDSAFEKACIPIQISYSQTPCLKAAFVKFGIYNPTKTRLVTYLLYQVVLSEMCHHSVPVLHSSTIIFGYIPINHY